MLEFFIKLFAVDFMPHVYCLRLNEVIWLHVISDAMIALAYLAIPLVLVSLVRRRKDLAFSGVFVLFGVFILACGATHILGIVTLWQPMYRLEGVVKAITAIASVLTAIATYRLLPQAVAIPGQAMLQDLVEERTRDLAISNARFRAATDAVGDVLWTNDAEGRMTGDQPGWSRLTGQSPQEYQGYGWSQAVHPDDAEPTIRAWNAAVAESGVFNFEHRVRRHDGQWRSFAIRAVPVRNSSGQIVEWVGLHRDITEQREREAALLEARLAAESSSRAKSAFLANMSHELRTPLNAIIGYSELLREQAALSAVKSADKDLDAIQLAARHLLGLINNVLDLSKIEAGKADVVAASFQVESLLREIHTLLSPLAERNGNQFILDLPHAIGIARTDEPKLRQTLINLVGNAIKFTSHGTITLRAENAGSSLRFTVVDTGIGMTDEERHRIFEAFTQAAASTAARYGGTGLGLTISKHYMELLGGAISCVSRKGEGSSFSVTIPREYQNNDIHQTATRPS
jgi:PAS domain S-box-containing protein